MAKENQHFVPVSHLRRFAIEGEKSLIWEYDKRQQRVSRHPKSVKKICSRHNYYNVTPINDDLSPTLLEDVLGNSFEGPYSRLVDKITRDLKRGISLDQNERKLIASIIGLQLCRGPSFRDGIENFLKGILQSSAELLHKNNQFPKAPPELENLIENVGFSKAIDIKVNTEASLEAMLNSAGQLAESILKKTWSLVYSSKEVFVTSDNPVVWQSDSKFAGPAHPSSTIQFPITQNITLVIQPKTNSKNELYLLTVTKDLLQQINSLTIAAATQYIYSSQNDNSILECVIKHKNSKQGIR